MSVDYYLGVHIKFALSEGCPSCKYQLDCHILRKYPSVYYDFICDFYQRKRISGALRRKKAKYNRERRTVREG